MANTRVLKSWAIANKYMLNFSTIAFISLLICSGFRGPSDRADESAPSSAVGLFLGCVMGGKVADLVFGGDRSVSVIAHFPKGH